MAERRMFSKKIIDSDMFLEMPLSSQALYFHLSMRADDDGFIDNARKVQRLINATDDDLKLLIAKQFLLPFETGVLVVTHWRIHNYIRPDRYKETMYQEEKSLLVETKNKAFRIASERPQPALNDIPNDIPDDIPNGYQNNGIPNDIPMVYQMDTDVKTLENEQVQQCHTNGIPNGYQMDTQSRLGKDNIESISHNNNIVIYTIGPRNNIQLSEGEIDALKNDFREAYPRLIEESSNRIFQRKDGDTIKSYYAYIRAIAKDIGLETVTERTAQEKQKEEKRKAVMRKIATDEANLGFPVGDKYKPYFTEEEIIKLNETAERKRLE